MKEQWFIYKNDMVTGPYSTLDVKSGHSENRWGNDSLIWWKGQRGWIPIEKWIATSNDIINGSQNSIQTVVWYADQNDEQKGPLNWAELKRLIDLCDDLDNFKVWTLGMKKWAKVYEIYEVAKQLNISRRAHTRAPIQADVTIKRPAHEFNMRAAEISEGGISLKGEFKFKKGEEVSLTIKSPLLSKVIETKARVAYSTKAYTGFQFLSILPEYRLIIFDYARQFDDIDFTIKKSAA